MDPNEVFVVIDDHRWKHNGIALGAVLLSKFPNMTQVAPGMFQLGASLTSTLLAIRADGPPWEAE